LNVRKHCSGYSEHDKDEEGKKRTGEKGEKVQ